MEQNKKTFTKKTLKLIMAVTVSLLLALNFTACDRPMDNLFILTGHLPDGKVGIQYAVPLKAVHWGGFDITNAVKWEIYSFNLPPGLSLSESGVISGIPTRAGTSHFEVILRITDAKYVPKTQKLSITILEADNPA